MKIVLLFIRVLRILLSGSFDAEAATAERRDPLAAADPAGGFDGPVDPAPAGDLDESGLSVLT